MQIAVNGAKEIYRKIKKPIVTEDSITYIDVIGGPGPVSNKVLKEIKVSGVLDLMKNKTNRLCYIESCLVYYDGRVLKKFQNKVNGVISKKISYKQGEPIWVGPTHHEFGGGYNSIYIPHFGAETNRTLADCTAEEGLIYGYREKNFKQLLDFLFEK